MKVIFLGCGYLGYNLSEALKNKQEVEVWGLDSPYASLSTCFRNVDVFNLDELSKYDLNDAIIVDTVSLVSNSATSDNDDLYLEKLKNKYNELFNYLKTRNINSYYFISSGGTVYGETNIPIKENHELLPKTLYAKSKVMLEECLKDSGLNYVILRLSNPYGGFQVTDKKQGVIPILIEKILKNEEFELWGESNTVRDYIYIDDLGQLFNKLIDHKIHNETINVGSGVGHSLKEVFDLVEKNTNKKINVKHVPSDVPIVKSIILDITKLLDLTKIDINTTLDEGIKKEVKRIQEELK